MFNLFPVDAKSVGSIINEAICEVSEKVDVHCIDMASMSVLQEIN